MHSFGIYTLANDAVYDQLVALLNSIEANVSSEIPVCVIPYDDRIEKVRQELKDRDNVTLYANQSAIERWEAFAREVWSHYPKQARGRITSRSWLYQGHSIRKMSAFQGEFEKFVFYDADTLAMKPLDDVVEKLDRYDFVFDDWEHAKSRPVATLNLSEIEASGKYEEPEVRAKMHCSSFFGSKRGIFAPDELAGIKKRLLEEGEVSWINLWWSDNCLFNYLTLVCDRPIFNYTLSPKGEEITGNCADSDPLVNIDNKLYNQQGLKPIYRIHYMNFSAKEFARLSQGEAVDIPHRDVFLHYRFLKEPDRKPQELNPPGMLEKSRRWQEKAVQKVKRTLLAIQSSF